MRDKPMGRAAPPWRRLAAAAGRWAGGAAPTAELPILHRLTILYLMLPIGIWILGYFRWWCGLPATLLLGAGLWRAMSGSWRATPTPMTLLLPLLALGWVMLTAAGGLLDVNNGDWHKHRGILTDLAHHPWPVHLRDHLLAFLLQDAGQLDVTLRYYLGYYMVPGLLGRWFGTAALSWAVPLWTWGGVALLLLLFIRRFTRLGAVAIATLILVGFSGMDFLRILILFGEAPLFGSQHLENDPLLMYRLQYVSNMATLMWAPQHFIAGGLYTMLILQLRAEPRFLACSGILLAGCLFWSPFVAAGLLPFLGIMVLERRGRPFLSWQNVLLAAPLAALLITFLTSGSGEIVRGWLWERSPWPELARWLPVFIMTEFLVLGLLLWRCQPSLGRERFFIVGMATLTVLPIYTFGYFNDLGMRASLPSLLVLCWYCAEVLSTHPWRRPAAVPAAERPRRHAKPPQGIAQNARKQRALQAPSNNGWARHLPAMPSVVAGLLALTLVVGAITPLHELARAWENAGTFPYGRRLASTETDTPRPFWTQFTAREVPAWLRSALKPHEVSVSPAWERVATATFNVYRSGKALVYERAPCSGKDLTPFFFVDVWPTHVGELPEHRRRHGFERLLYPNTEFLALWQGDRCALTRSLPDYAIQRVRTGQIDGGDVIWQRTFAPP